MLGAFKLFAHLGEIEIVVTVGGDMPGGNDTELQYNDNGAFGGLSFFKKTNTTGLTFTGGLAVDNTGATGVNITFVNGASLAFDDTSSFFFTANSLNLISNLVSIGNNQSGIAASAPGTDLSNGLNDGGFIQTIELQNSYTANQTVAHANLSESADNTGAIGEVDFTLPDPTAWAKGLEYSFCVTTAQILKIIATGGATIYNGTSTSSANGTMQSNSVGSFVRIVSRDFGAGGGYSGTDWVVESVTGSWALA